jgi:hypothetical protein
MIFFIGKREKFKIIENVKNEDSRFQGVGDL